ncbi:hypothetical protein, partial [Vibrio parahaemolyticus]|uniref:hypothetical protein n=1 Tax=Vibrio parahaemolyticus TaxID=670 RepID=UPI001C5F8331
CKSVDLGSTPGRASIISKARLLWLAFLVSSARKSLLLFSSLRFVSFVSVSPNSFDRHSIFYTR